VRPPPAAVKARTAAGVTSVPLPLTMRFTAIRRFPFGVRWWQTPQGFATGSTANPSRRSSAVGPRPRTQPERGVNREGRKRAEKGQKMANGTKGALKFVREISGLGWLAETIWQRTFSAT
jgi:hypothetical protein